MRAAGRIAAACALGVVLLSPLRAEADADKRDAPGWAFGSQPGELALLGGAGASLLTYFLPQRYNTGWKPNEVRAFEPVWGSLSDLTGSVIGCTVQIANGYMFETAYLDHPAVDNPYERALRLPLIAGEATMFTTGVIIAMKRITGRCRPRAYKSSARSCGSVPAGESMSSRVLLRMSRPQRPSCCVPSVRGSLAR